MKARQFIINLLSNIPNRLALTCSENREHQFQGLIYTAKESNWLVWMSTYGQFLSKIYDNHPPGHHSNYPCPFCDGDLLMTRYQDGMLQTTLPPPKTGESHEIAGKCQVTHRE